MWLMTKHGFYSIVQKPDGIHIRAREREDLERLKNAWDRECVNPSHVFYMNRHNMLPGDIPQILETPLNDYRWRVIIQSSALGQVMTLLGESITYPNFKAQIDSDPAQRRKPYHKVWSLLARALGAYGDKGEA